VVFLLTTHFFPDQNLLDARFITSNFLFFLASLPTLRILSLSIPEILEISKTDIITILIETKYFFAPPPRPPPEVLEFKIRFGWIAEGLVLT